MTLGNFFQEIPHLRTALENILLGATNGVNQSKFFEALNDKRLEESEGHFLRKAALVKLKLRTNDDDGTTGVVHALTEQVLTEASVLTLEHVADRLQLTVTIFDRFAVATVVQESIDGFLEHAHFIMDDDVRRLHLNQCAQTIVTVNNATVEIV